MSVASILTIFKLFREVGQNSVEETLKEKMQSYLAHSKKDNETAVKSDDDKSMREVIKKERTKDDDSCSLDTLSEQDSITSETEIDGINHHVEDVAKPEEEIISNIPSQNEDIVQDVMDMNVLLCKLKSILMEVLLNMKTIILTFSCMNELNIHFNF